MKWLVKKPIEAMAVVNPTLCNQLSIQVEVEQRNEGPIPHVHVYLDKSRNPRKCAYIRLDMAEYSPHHKSATLTRKAKKEFIEVMSRKCPLSYFESVTDDSNIKAANGYEDAVRVWLQTYPGSEKFFTFDQDGFPVMPNYENL